MIALICIALPAGAGAAREQPVWLCKPGKERNPCKRGLRTTLITPTGEPIEVKEVRAPKRRKIDCFYVYPTVSDQEGPNASLRIHPEQRSIALTQALRELIANEIDDDPELRRRTLSALLLGGDVTVEEGRDVGGDFEHVRACRKRTQLHCVIAFSTFNDPVPDDAVFGRTAEPRLEVLCTNPAGLRGVSASLRTVYPSKPFAQETSIGAATRLVGFPEVDVSTRWIEADGAYTGRCSSANGADVLQITDVGGAPHLRAVPNAAWGLHLTDANIALGNLVNVIRRQIAEYVARR
jgi:Protein of unknown function (DUF3089)